MRLRSKGCYNLIECNNVLSPDYDVFEVARMEGIVYAFFIVLGCIWTCCVESLFLLCGVLVDSCVDGDRDWDTWLVCGFGGPEI